MRLVVLAMGIGLLATGAVSAQAQGARGTTGSAPTASASLKDTEGRVIGDAVLQQTPHGVLLKLELRNATPGVHALHIHERGQCDAPTFESAGGHFAPAGTSHGFHDAKGPHAGDLPNIHVPASQELTVEYLVRGVTLEQGRESFFDADGSAIVMHRGADDYTSEPAGDAGNRLACGPIMRSNK